MSIKNVKIKEFTVFKDVAIDFARGINVIIGENGTGKTHLIKLLYAQMNEDIELKTYFTPNKFHYSLEMKMVKVKSSTVFIPAKDMLTHSKSFMSMYDKFEMPFDRTYYDIISKSLLPNLKEIPTIGKTILPKIEKIIGGKVLVENEIFYIEYFNGGKIEFSLEAEGIKKIAILWQLIMNESITKDSVLFWDEPEANINPSLISAMVEILLELSRQGVQIFVATHNFIFAKYIEVLMKEHDNVAFHALYKTEKEGVKCETKEKFTFLTHNAIREENINIYDAEMKKEME